MLDILPPETFKWQYVRRVIDRLCEDFGFREIIIPTVEHTELFARGVGDTTDIVSKEMYTFEKSDRSLTLRPEGTAGVARAVLEHGLYAGTLPLRLYYVLSCFRYEKPQAGRYREHYQFGIETFGSPEPYADVEIIELAAALFERLGVKRLSLEINSIGCPECRKSYPLREYLKAHESELCGTCHTRLERNPMRVLDCKSPVCKEIAAQAPTMVESLCGDCRTHFDGVQNLLRNINLDYKINPHIVRGQDYYTRTVFEFVSREIGAKDTVCGGGRYDQMGGPQTPALGFGMGVDRLLMVMEKENAPFPQP
jgi:histidyl-tRNA synthetase